MTHLAEERDVAASPEAIWSVVSDTTRWPEFFATPQERGHLRFVEYLDGATRDGPHVKRRLAFTGLPAWDEQVSRWSPHESVAWLGIRNPGQKYWTQQMEIIPGRGRTTLRWEIFYQLNAPRAVRKAYHARLEELVVASLARIERLAKETKT